MKSTYQELPIEDVILDVDNPRIKMYLEIYQGQITAEGIALALNTDGGLSFSSLKESIRVNKGIINPILVNHTADGKYVVIEGNTRVQIYRDFNKIKPGETWSTIRALVYEQLDAEQIHSIRLQSHLVGPREWDRYSKAKYLYQLSEEESLPMETIISFCGGKKSEITQLIETYKTMQQYYMPMVVECGDDPDFKEFSKFEEAQKKSIQHALLMAKFTNKDFAEWVVSGRVDTAQNVRQLPQVLKDEFARKEFLKPKGRLSDAIKKLSREVSESIDLSSVPYEELAEALLSRVRLIQHQEVKMLKKSDSDEYSSKRDLLLTLSEDLNDLVGEIKED